VRKRDTNDENISDQLSDILEGNDFILGTFTLQTLDLTGRLGDQCLHLVNGGSHFRGGRFGRGFDVS
jgi:uncharacterized protein YutD